MCQTFDEKEPAAKLKDRNTKGQHDDSQQSPIKDDESSSYRIPGNDRPKSVRDRINVFGKFFYEVVHTSKNNADMNYLVDVLDSS